MNTYTRAAALLLAALALTACGAEGEQVDRTKFDDAADLACSVFASGHKKAQTQQARIDLAKKVMWWAESSVTNGISDNALAMMQAADAGAGPWKTGGDAFTQACFHADWKS